ncbi:ABC transporter permease [Falsiroseomonas selenitidurans]|uniref:ABC transporter permease n=1 Tax=Falsiroseomonas selenitidurans TaxID=2716335 RepID=A0ABX1E1W2_9PROT|nr:ABC transporter permease [Falsiroseomonas selenitidurans]NKC29813.1 ABC transporter permease [Falsiroseomonas selenitidurans]
MSLGGFLWRRALVALPVLLGILFLTFMLVRIGDQDPVAMLAGPMADAPMLARIRAELMLDQPLLTQFWAYLGRLVQGDLGLSWQGNAPVTQAIADHLPATLELVTLAVGIGALVGVPVGLRAAERPNGWFDQASRFGSLFGFSLPTYWLGLMAIFVFFYLLGWAPAPMGRVSMMVTPPEVLTGSVLLDSLLAGNGEAAWSAAAQLVLPVGCFAIVATAPIIKHTRAIAIEVMGSDYIRYARACGFPRRIIRRIALRAALVPVITFVGSEFTSLLAAASLIEFVFAWGGLGHWGLNAILLGDFAAVQGYVLVLAIASVLVFALVDLVVLLLEPRARA